MDGEKNSAGDFILDEMAYLGNDKAKSKKVVTGKTTPKDLILNALSAVAVMGVVAVCNLLITPDFHYTQLFSWNFGILVVLNWISGVVMTYFLRQSGINSAKMTDGYIISEREKQKAFEKIKDITTAQIRLNKLIEEDFDIRRQNLEAAIAKLVKPKMPKLEDGTVKEWHIGDELPKGTHIKIVKMKKRLESMTPPEISLAALSQSEASYNIKSLYEVRPSPEKTGGIWWAKKGAGKVGWFAAFPVILSILANGLAVGVTISNVVYTIGIIGIMLFNAGREYALAFWSVSRFGVDRNNQIIKILQSVTENKDE